MIGLMITVLFALGTATTSSKTSSFLSAFMAIFYEDNVCRTAECFKTAEDLMASIDESIDPCEDFYGFACNGWIKNHPIPATAISWNQFNALNEKLDMRLKKILSEGIKKEDEDMVKATKMIYRACMDEERIEKKGVQPLLDLIEELKGWPLTYPSEEANWPETAILVSKKVGISPVLAVGVDVNLRDTSRNVIIIDQPVSSTPSYFFDDPSFGREYSFYLMKVALALMKNTTPSYNFRRQIRQIIQFEKLLTILTKKKEELRVLDRSHNSVTIKHLQNWMDNLTLSSPTTRVDWKKYLQDLLEKDETEINDDTEVVVSDWKILQDLFQLIDTSQPETVVNYMIWEVVKTMTRMTNKKMRQMEFELKKSLSGVMEDIPRWQECVHATDDVTFAVGYMYVKKHFGNEAKAKAISIVENIREEFRKELSEVDWIDEETKRAALEKADYMNHFIGSPDWYGNDTALNEYYKGLKIGRDHFRNMIAVRQFLAKKYLMKLNKQTRRDEWATGPAIINAYYDPRLNSIIFPAGILDSPFFNKDRPDALNYGSIGSIIGHEITHAFDDVGRQGDKFGNIHQWWSSNTEKTYLQNAFCFVDKYSQYTFPQLENLTMSKVHLNGLLTLGENIADNGGLATALRAYKKYSRSGKLPGLKRFTADQLFYLGFATTWCETTSDASLIGEVLEGPHSPHIVRVIGSVSNSQHFAETWKCKPGSKMNPIKKCNLW